MTDSYGFLRDYQVVDLPHVPFFDAAEKFVVNYSADAPVKIVSITGNIGDYCDPIGRELAESSCYLATVRRPMIRNNLVRLTELDKSPIHPAHVYEIMKRQPNGEKSQGGLHVNRWRNIFVISPTGIIVLLYYSQERAQADITAGERVDMYYPGDGYVVHFLSINSDKSCQGDRIGLPR